MKHLISAALVVTATAATAERPTQYAYEATMQTLGAGAYDILAHELANCPARHGSEAQLFAVIQATGQQREAALNALFENNVSAQNCVVEVLLRYDLLEEAS